jgi:hypothetical protein
LRQIRVGRLQAIKAAAEFIQETKIKAQGKFTEESTVSRVDEKKNGTSTKVFEESTLTQIEAVLKVPPRSGRGRAPTVDSSSTPSVRNCTSKLTPNKN